MPPRSKLDNEIGLLRTIVGNMVTKPVPPREVTQDYLRCEDLARVLHIDTGLVGILLPGRAAFTHLAEIISKRHPKIVRGARFENYEEKYFKILIADFAGRDPKTIVEADVAALEKGLVDWFDTVSAARTVFVPCLVTHTASRRFSIGPVTFIHIDDVNPTEYHRIDAAGEPAATGDLNRILDMMRTERSHWLAVAEVQGCDRDKAFEIANLSVDLAIVTLQLAQPFLGTRNMSRLATRRGPAMLSTLSVSEGFFSGDWSNKEPGLSIGAGLLNEITTNAAALVTSVGNFVNSFTTGTYRLPKLEQAWCDAAYWLHQGLAEPLDSIAVSKLETAIEVLLGAESSKGSKSRLMKAMDAIYGLGPTDPIHPASTKTTEQFSVGLVSDRSQILHGTRSTLSTKFNDSRDRLENLAITMVRAAALEFEEYVHTASPGDNADAFMAWVKWRRQQPDRQRPSQK